MDAMTRLDYYALGRQYVLSKATSIEPSKVDVDGSNVNIFVGSTSVMVDAVSRQLAYSINRLYLDGAVGEDLDRLVWDRYQQTRKGASAALGSVRMYRASIAGGAGTVPVGTSLKTKTGTQYTTTTIASFGAGDYTSYASVRASQAGKAPEVGANMIQKFANPDALFDPSLQCNNDLTTAGGEDAEDDDTFKNRIRSFWLTARRGTLGAIEQGATSVPGVVSARAVEALSGGGLPARIVNLYVADSSGVASAELAGLVRQSLEDYRAGGIAVLVWTSLPLLVDVRVAVAFQAGTPSATLTGQIKTALFEYVNSLGVNDVLRVADLFTVLTRFKQQGALVTKGSIASPAGDLVPAVGQTIRTVLSAVLVNGR